MADDDDWTFTGVQSFGPTGLTGVAGETGIGDDYVMFTSGVTMPSQYRKFPAAKVAKPEPVKVELKPEPKGRLLLLDGLDDK